MKLKMFLGKLKEFPKDKTLILITIITFVPFILVTILVFCINEYRLETTTGYGVLNFELAWTPEMINKIFTAWGPDEMKRQALVTYIDYLYIPFYGLFGAECILLASRKKLTGSIQKAGLFITLTPLAAGMFDAVENVNLLLMLSDETYARSFCPFFASLCATFKISFLVAGGSFLLAALTGILPRISSRGRI